MRWSWRSPAGRVREWIIDSVFARGRSRDSIIQVDTAYAEWQGASAAGSGTLGWARAAHGEDAVHPGGRQPDRLRLAPARRERAAARYRRPTCVPLGGRARGTVRLSGSLDTLDATGELAVDGFEFQQATLAAARGHLHLDRRQPAPAHRGSGRAIRSRSASGTSPANSVALAGYVDSLGWSAGKLVRPRRPGWMRPDAGASPTAPTGLVRQPAGGASLPSLPADGAGACSRSASRHRRSARWTSSARRLGILPGGGHGSGGRRRAP